MPGAPLGPLLCIYTPEENHRRPISDKFSALGPYLKRTACTKLPTMRLLCFPDLRKKAPAAAVLVEAGKR